MRKRPPWRQDHSLARNSLSLHFKLQKEVLLSQISILHFSLEFLWLFFLSVY